MQKKIFEPLGILYSTPLVNTYEHTHRSFTTIINNKRCIISLAEKTAKKTGFFVTFWKKDHNNKSLPYDTKDPLDVLIIIAEEDVHYGVLILSRELLTQKKIVSSASAPGKRGFRIYTDWNRPESRHARITQQWQSQYFLNLSGIRSLHANQMPSCVAPLTVTAQPHKLYVFTFYYFSCASSCFDSLSARFSSLSCV